jgi:TPR repeat protein
LPNKTGDGVEKQEILNCLKSHNINLQEIYNWLLNDQRNSNSFTLLGDFNLLGMGINVDKTKAFELYQKAADLGNSTAQCNLAFMYMNGIEIVKNIDKAVYWYKKSAEQGDQDAHNKLEKLKENKKQFM